MPKPETRGSLIGLRSTLPAVPKVAPVVLTAEMEDRILGTETQEKKASETMGSSIHKDVFTATSPTDAISATVSGARATSMKKEPSVLMNAKLPISLHAKLKRTAQFNDISMTDILIRAIEAELATGRYAAPPETWGSDIAY